MLPVQHGVLGLNRWDSPTFTEDLLPIGVGRVSHATLRRHTLTVGARLDERVSEPDEYDWLESRREPVLAARNLSVAIDGTYIRADRLMWLGEYHVVAGRMEREGQLGGHFAWVAQHRLCDSGTFMKAALEGNGWRPDSQVRVLADGADGLSNLVSAAAGKATERVLDWFHISMRLRPIEQMSSKMAIAVGDSDAELKQLLAENCRGFDISFGTAKARLRLSESGRSIALPSNWTVGLMKTQNGFADSGNT